MRTLALLLGLLAVCGNAFASEASRLAKQARQAEKAGEAARAYILYTEAAALEPNNKTYAARATALQTRANLEAKPVPKVEPPNDAEPDVIIEPPQHFDSPTAKEYAEARKPLPPTELQAQPGRKDFDLRGDAKSLFEQVAKAFGLDCVFDYDYQAGPSIRFQMQQADYREGLHALQTVTSSFVVPLSSRIFMVVKDTPQKRKEVEPSVSVTIPLPEPTTAQDLTGLIAAVQQATALEKVAWDTQKNQVVIRDRISKVTAARQIFEQLLYPKPQIEVQVQFVEVSSSDMMQYGLALPTSFPLLYVGNLFHNTYTVPSGISWLGAFGGGLSMFGLGLSDIQLLANMTQSSAQTLLESEVRAVDGQSSSMHFGQKYPILTSGYFGPQGSSTTGINNNYTSGGAYGTGNGIVNYTVAANNSNAPRTGTLTIGYQTFTITQAGTGGAGGTCIYTLSSTTAAPDATASTGTVDVAADSSCAWTAASNAAWIAVTDGATGSGNGTVTYTVTANPDNAQRVGTITIAGQTFTITQAGTGTGCSYSLLPNGQSYSADGATDSVQVTATFGCTWTATSPVNWILIESGFSGNGSGIVTFQVGPNYSTQRTATLTIAGQSFLVTQVAYGTYGCTYTLSPTAVTVIADGTSDTVNVSAPAGCGWTASSNVSWVTITNGGTVNSGGYINGGGLYTPPPSFTFEDLGFSLKVTPHVHGLEEVTLDIESEFRLLAGSAVNGIPIVANRQLKSTVTLQEGEQAMVAGMMTTSEAHTISGLAGLATLPLAGRFLRQNTRQKDDAQLLILIRPRLLSVPPTEVETRAVRVGSEERPFIPL